MTECGWVTKRLVQRWPLKREDFADGSARRTMFRRLLEERFRSTNAFMQELVFGELVTNAQRHGIEPMSVVIVIRNGMVKIQVEDAGTGFDLDRKLEEEATPSGGRGLKIVHTLADSLTIEPTATHGCRVTATMSL